MPGNEFPIGEFPDDIESSIRQVMVETGLSRDEIVLQLLSYFFELVNDKGNENVPPLVKKVRAARSKKTVNERIAGD